MPGSRWGQGRLVPPPAGVPLAHTPVSLPRLLWVLLYFFNSLCIGVGREHLIFIIWFREGPEALSHCMVSMETDLFGELSVAVGGGGRRETYSKIRLHKCGRSCTNSLQGHRERLGKVLGSLLEGLPLPTHWGPSQELLCSPGWLLASCCFSLALSE